MILLYGGFMQNLCALAYPYCNSILTREQFTVVPNQQHQQRAVPYSSHLIRVLSAARETPRQLKHFESVLPREPIQPRQMWRLGAVEPTFPGHGGKFKLCRIRMHGLQDVFTNYWPLREASFIVSNLAWPSTSLPVLSSDVDSSS